MMPGAGAHACNPVVQEAEAGGSRVQSQPQQQRGPEPLSQTLSLNKIQNRAQWLSAPEFNPWYPLPLLALALLVGITHLLGVH